jgi:hypothetical protein
MPARRLHAALNLGPVGVLLFLPRAAHAGEPVEHAMTEHHYGSTFG